MMRSLRTAAVIAALVLAPAACVHTSKNAPEELPTYLRVENQALTDATVYVYQNAARVRLGRVSSLSTATLRIPASQIFGPTPLTESITVVPGDTVVLQVPPQ